jgi:pimeloyl-ACP methyl ester carboxylesterase
MDIRTNQLAQVLSGDRRELFDPQTGVVSYYADGPSPAAPTSTPLAAPPVLLIHSINASASAHEIKPIYDRLKSDRRVYALDLPGFGFSERSDRDYPQSLMVDAILAVIAAIRSETGNLRVDALAVSLSCEFLGKAALKDPESVRTLALVSPTGFEKSAGRRRGSPDKSRGVPGILRALRRPWLGPRLYRLLSSRVSIRFFLRKTWGSKAIDEEMFETSCRMSEHPEAHWAPFYFLSGFLFSANIPEVYRALQQPVWLSHGVRGDFTDFKGTAEFKNKPDWHIDQFDTGALPYFEIPAEFVENYTAFLDSPHS